LENSQKETKQLRQRIDMLQRENDALKRSLFELSAVVPKKPHEKNERTDLFFDVTSFLEKDQPSLAPQKTKHIEDDVPFNLDSHTKEKGKDSRHLYYKYQLEGHTGAVYTVQFSPKSRILASGSFDKTVRLWDTRSQKEVRRLEKHTVNVSDLCWAKDGASLISGSFDQTCNLWEVEVGKCVATYKVDGFVQCVSMVPTQENFFLCGTTRKNLYLFDKRKPNDPYVISVQAMVNSVYASKDGYSAITGDSDGQIKTWDLRMGTMLTSEKVTTKPISHIQISSRANEEDVESRYMAVNSYDNILRVYDRGTFPPKSKLDLLHSLKGHRNQNYPIKSSFFHGKDHISLKSRQLPDLVIDEGAGLKEVDHELETSVKGIDESLLLATGSADRCAYIFDVGREGELVQKLEGHTDRVHSVNFHPTEPILATCSADFTIKIWFANRRSK